MGDKDKKEILKDRVIASIKNGDCVQCTFPWYDGMCECGKEYSEESNKEDMRISKIAYDLLRCGYDLKDIRELDSRLNKEINFFLE